LQEEDDFIKDQVARNGQKWRHISRTLIGRSDDAVRNRWFRLTHSEHRTSTRKKNETKRIMWSKEEDVWLTKAVMDGNRLSEICNIISSHFTVRTKQGIRQRIARLSLTHMMVQN
jgi:hypothetical protein